MNLTQTFVASLLRTRDPFSHKGTYGHALIVAGSYGKIGAAVLSAGACLRSGVGLLTVCVPACGYTILQSTVPEAMVLVDGNLDCFTEPVDTTKYSAVGIGPGLGADAQTAKALFHMLQHATAPLVLDADALNLLAANSESLNHLPANTVLTPHPKEFERLAGTSADHEERTEKQMAFSKQHNVFVVLKDHHTCISTPKGEVYYNTTGNPGMATGGSGDVLTGVITALLAQGYDALQACQLGVFVHGYAGDLARDQMGEVGMIAGDICDQLPYAFKALSLPTN